MLEIENINLIIKIRYESRKKSTTEPSYSMVELRVDYRKNF